jgi:hypothetical protein
MIQTIDKYGFEQAFKKAGRGEQFSYAALGALFDYFEEYEESTGEQIELDVVAICCEYAESSLSEIADNYSINLEGLEGEARIEAVVKFMENHTTIVGMVDDETMVYQQF